MAEAVASSSGVVVPRKLKWFHVLAASIVYGLIEAIGFTLRMRWDKAAPPERISPQQRAIFCIWHNRLAVSQIVYRDYICGNGRSPKLAAMVSASKDGGILARVLERFKVQPVRGSSSRRGQQALLELTGWGERGYDLAITPDGPRGPRYALQPGVISLGQLTGLPIVPISYHYNWKISLRSWDRFQIPIPFSSAVLRMGKPVTVPRDSSEEQREIARRELEAILREMTLD